MKKLYLAALFMGLSAVLLAAALDLSGKWEIESNFDDASLSGGGFDCVLKQEAERLAGSCADAAAPVTGEVKGQNVSWQMKGAQQSITFTGTVNETGTSMKGRFMMAGKGGNFTAVRSK